MPDRIYLYQAERGIRVNVPCTDGSKWLTFHRVDGSYSTCATERGNLVYLYAMTQLERDGENWKVVVTDDT